MHAPRTTSSSRAPAPASTLSALTPVPASEQAPTLPPAVETQVLAAVPQPARASTSDVLVVGAGMIGAAAAWQALRAGLTVTCLDPTPGAGASFAAAGVLAPVTETTLDDDALIQLRVASAALWPAFASELVDAARLAGAALTDVGFANRGTLAVGYAPADAEQLDRLHALHGVLGLRSEPISVAEARKREPSLAPHLSCALWVEGDHQVDPRSVHRALQAVLAADSHATVLRSGATTLLLGKGGQVTGVVDAHGGVHHAGTVVLAAGTASGRLVAATGQARLPVRSISGQTLRLRPLRGPVLRHVVRGTVQTRSIYIVPREDGEIVVGATSNGSDSADVVPASAPGRMFALLRDARTLVPGIDERASIEVTNRGRPGTPDNLPLIGETGVPGLLAATGHARHGIVLTPLTALALGALFGNAPSASPALAAVMALADPRRFAAPTTA